MKPLVHAIGSIEKSIQIQESIHQQEINKILQQQEVQKQQLSEASIKPLKDLESFLSLPRERDRIVQVVHEVLEDKEKIRPSVSPVSLDTILAKNYTNIIREVESIVELTRSEVQVKQDSMIREVKQDFRQQLQELSTATVNHW